MTQEAIQVLIVEDDPLFIRLITSMLHTKHYGVRGVSSAEEALGILESESFNLLITDLKMEGIGGIGLIRALTESAIFPVNRILVITGEAPNSEDSVWVRRQNIPILPKPFSVKSLLALVDSIVQANS